MCQVEPLMSAHQAPERTVNQRCLLDLKKAGLKEMVRRVRFAQKTLLH